MGLFKDIITKFDCIMKELKYKASQQHSNIPPRKPPKLVGRKSLYLLDTFFTLRLYSNLTSGMKWTTDMLHTKDYLPQRCDALRFGVQTFLQNNGTQHHSTIFANNITSPLSHK